MSDNNINPKAVLENEPERWLEEHSKNLSALNEDESHQETLLRILRKYCKLRIIFPSMDYSRFSDYLKCEKLEIAIQIMNRNSTNANSEGKAA